MSINFHESFSSFVQDISPRVYNSTCCLTMSDVSAWQCLEVGDRGEGIGDPDDFIF